MSATITPKPTLGKLIEENFELSTVDLVAAIRVHYPITSLSDKEIIRELRAQAERSRQEADELEAYEKARENKTLRFMCSSGRA